LNYTRIIEYKFYSLIFIKSNTKLSLLHKKTEKTCVFPVFSSHVTQATNSHFSKLVRK